MNEDDGPSDLNPMNEVDDGPSGVNLYVKPDLELNCVVLRIDAGATGDSSTVTIPLISARSLEHMLLAAIEYLENEEELPSKPTPPDGTWITEGQQP